MQQDKEVLSLLLLTADDLLAHQKELLTIIPELIVCKDFAHNHPAHIYNILEHILHVTNHVDKDLELKLAALLHDIGKPYAKRTVNGRISYLGHPQISQTLAALILKRLAYDEVTIQHVCWLVEHHDDKLTCSEIATYKDALGEALVFKLLRLQISDIKAHAPEYAQIKLEYLKQLIQKANLENRISL